MFILKIFDSMKNRPSGVGSGGGGVGGVGKFLRNFRNISEKFPGNFLKITGWPDN